MSLVAAVGVYFSTAVLEQESHVVEVVLTAIFFNIIRSLEGAAWFEIGNTMTWAKVVRPGSGDSRSGFGSLSFCQLAKGIL